MLPRDGKLLNTALNYRGNHEHLKWLISLND